MISKKQYNKYYFDHPEIWIKLREASLSKEIDFLIKIIKRYLPKAKSILDVGCGTGNHCYALSVKGYSTTGIDINPYMIDFAKNKYKNINFQVMDMGKIKYEKLEKFDIVICLCTTFTYNTNTKQILSVLKSFHKLLNKNGLLVLEFFNPISFLGKNISGSSFFQEDIKHYHKIGLNLNVNHEIDEKRQLLLETKKIYSLKTNKLLSTDKTKFRLFFPQEISFYLEQVGFITRNQYGKYDSNYLNLDRVRLITVATRSSL